MLKPISISLAAALTAAALPGLAQAQKLPDLAGTYKCQPEPSPCQTGQTFNVTQSGAKVDFKSDNGNVGEAKLTSPISISAGAPFNMLGTITSDSHVIDWSNGTQWHKQ